ncbi:MAG TPA: DUF4395 domain-containing protein [Jatrophihabitantaceae bacterium]|nr:DUF4395 domain-containing protein [Jatrophihabitantaceae bacterium]
MSARLARVNELLRFPNPVNEVAARTVAVGVLLLSLSALVLSKAVGSGWLWLTVPLAYGFVARVLTGPTLSPLGQFATRVAAPRIGHANPVAGPPKRFAQGMGAVMSLATVVAHFGFGADGLTQVLLGVIVTAATLESVFAFCVGCTIFAWLMRAGLVPAQTCEACANVSLRLPAAA